MRNREARGKPTKNEAAGIDTAKLISELNIRGYIITTKEDWQAYTSRFKPSDEDLLAEVKKRGSLVFRKGDKGK